MAPPRRTDMGNVPSTTAESFQDASLNEIEALVKLAARGAGYSWGLAADAAEAARWLLTHRLLEADAIATTLKAMDGLPHQQRAPKSLELPWAAIHESDRLCPITTGATLADCADRFHHHDALVITSIATPAMLVPFAARAASRLQQILCLQWDDTRVFTQGTDVLVCGNALAVPHTSRVHCALQPSTRSEWTDSFDDLASQLATDAVLHPRTTRGRWTPSALDALSALASRQYAPATEESRARGAGAGLTDND